MWCTLCKWCSVCHTYSYYKNVCIHTVMWLPFYCLCWVQNSHVWWYMVFTYKNNNNNLFQLRRNSFLILFQQHCGCVVIDFNKSYLRCITRSTDFSIVYNKGRSTRQGWSSIFGVITKKEGVLFQQQQELEGKDNHNECGSLFIFLTHLIFHSYYWQCILGLFS